VSTTALSTACKITLPDQISEVSDAGVRAQLEALLARLVDAEKAAGVTPDESDDEGGGCVIA